MTCFKMVSIKNAKYNFILFFFYYYYYNVKIVIEKFKHWKNPNFDKHIKARLRLICVPHFYGREKSIINWHLLIYFTYHCNIKICYCKLHLLNFTFKVIKVAKSVKISQMLKCLTSKSSNFLVMFYRVQYLLSSIVSQRKKICCCFDPLYFERSWIGIWRSCC
jgi:hypothetical protein